MSETFYEWQRRGHIRRRLERAANCERSIEDRKFSAKRAREVAEQIGDNDLLFVAAIAESSIEEETMQQRSNRKDT